MKFAFYMNCVSAHQLPLAREVAELVGPENFCYVDAGETGQAFQTVERLKGLKVERLKGCKVERLKGCKGERFQENAGHEWIETADVMLTGMRDFALFERRAKKGLMTYFTAERWFKPIQIVRLFGLFDCSIPGWVRMLVPEYRRMAKRFLKWANGDPGGRVLAIGPWARKDFLRMGVRAEKIVDWGYFVAPSVLAMERRCGGGQRNFSILWCGRLLGLKRVDTIIRAVGKLKVEKLKGFKVERFQSFKVTLVGDGPEKGRLMKMARKVEKKGGCGQRNFSPEIEFLPSRPMEKVRELMRQHDLFVFPSNGLEGWGAVVSEALEEGVRVLASYECGAGAALLPRERLFHSGDWRALAQLIGKEMRGELPPCSIGEWTAEAAAKRLLRLKG